jgi:hypothetical protein
MARTKPSRSLPTQTPEEQLDTFIDKFDAKNAALIRAVRKALRKRFPTANELVYDNYNFFVIGYCSTERPLRLHCVAGRCGQRGGTVFLLRRHAARST